MEGGRESALHEAKLAWIVEVEKRDVAKGMRIGLLADPILKEVMWAAPTTGRLSS